MKNIFFVLIFFGFSLFSFGQITNGGFEIIDNTVLPAPNNYTYSINHATGWYNLKNTCDLGGVGFQSVTNPYLGTHNAGLAYPTNGMSEYFYGKTSNLIAGQNYLFSCWAKNDADDPTDCSIPIGVYISAGLPSETSVSTVSPQIKYRPTTHQYEKVEFCFTPSQSGIYNIVFGNFTTQTVSSATYYFIDEVSMVPFNGPFATSDLSIANNTVCIGSSVIVDGSSSVNETSYEFDVYDITTGSEVLKVNGAKQFGQAGTYNVSSMLSFVGVLPEEGDCYRVYLTTYNGCFNKKSIDFCYEKPQVHFLNTVNPICEGNPLTLSVTGDNGWSYNWSTGQTGVGLKNVTVNPPITLSHYTVTVTTLLGCIHTEGVDFVVHSAANQQPTLNGIDGTDEFTFYINSGDIVTFTSLISNDNTNENVTVQYDLSGLPNAYVFNYIQLPPSGIGNMSFYWNTDQGLFSDVSPGIYTFTVSLDDDNICTSYLHPKIYVFKIVVVCNYCPLTIDYENRTPTTTPLPTDTEVAQMIIAGNTQVVETGTNVVSFEAGQSIELGPNFSAGAGFTASIVPSSCVTDCQDCCTNWTGFVRDDYPEGTIINFYDTDPTNDFFQITDVNHPFCAYNAIGYHLVITDPSGSVYGESSYNVNIVNTACCPFVSPAPENAIPHASIWWDPWTTNIFGKTVRPYGGTYFFVLTLYGCNGTSEIFQSYFFISDPMKSISKIQIVKENEVLSKNIAGYEENYKILDSEINLSPNPAIDFVNVSGISRESVVNYQLFDDKGIMLTKFIELKNNQFDISNLVNGVYYCKLRINGEIITKKFIKL